AAEPRPAGCNAAGGDQPRRRHPAQAAEEGDEDPARAEPEERDADDQAGEVVDELEGEDARVADLEEDHREGDEQGLEVQPADHWRLNVAPGPCREPARGLPRGPLAHQGRAAIAERWPMLIPLAARPPRC